jgi:hypothetical protein
MSISLTTRPIFIHKCQLEAKRRVGPSPTGLFGPIPRRTPAVVPFGRMLNESQKGDPYYYEWLLDTRPKPLGILNGARP